MCLENCYGRSQLETMIHDDLLTIPDAARRKGVSRSAVYKAVAQGRLPVQSVLGRFALRAADVEAWRPKEQRGRRKGTAMSEESKVRISEGQKRRWAQRRAQRRSDADSAS